MKKINSRRYIGCKTKLLETIYSTVLEKGFNEENSFADIFAGTGSVGDFFARRNYPVLFNDNLYSNFVIYNGFYNKEEIDLGKIVKILDYFNDLDYGNLNENYFSTTYGNKYFSFNDAKKIGYIRDYIEDNKQLLNLHEYYYLLTSLIYAIDANANTVGHYESFLKKNPVDSKFVMEELDLYDSTKDIEIFNQDANQLSKLINYDIVYVDPPYNARQYVNFYHVLENLCRWNKPTEFEGNSMKFKRDELKSGYCRSNTAFTLFNELIQSLKCKLIVVSYNNTYSAKSISSNNTIDEEQIIASLQERGNVEKKEIAYRAFNSGKTNLSNHKEYLFTCEVIK